MTLTGTYSRNLDEKRRLAVPKRLREAFCEQELTSLFVAPGTDRCLLLYSPEVFKTMAERVSEKPSNRKEVRNYDRLFYSRAEKVDLDSQGRIRIPERLVAFAQLKRDAVLLGVRDHAEIWDRRLWEEFEERNSPEFDDMASQDFD